MASCARCGGPVEQSSGPGRPRSYCGAVCRRQSEYELRRVERHIASVETLLRRARFAEAMAPKYRRKPVDPAVAFWQAERAALEGRLRELLGQSAAESE